MLNEENRDEKLKENKKRLRENEEADADAQLSDENEYK